MIITINPHNLLLYRCIFIDFLNDKRKHRVLNPISEAESSTLMPLRQRLFLYFLLVESLQLFRIVLSARSLGSLIPTYSLIFGA